MILLIPFFPFSVLLTVFTGLPSVLFRALLPCIFYLATQSWKQIDWKRCKMLPLDSLRNTTVRSDIRQKESFRVLEILVGLFFVEQNSMITVLYFVWSHLGPGPH